MVKTRNNIDTKSSAADDSKSPTTMQMFQQIMAHLDNQKKQLSTRCNNISDKYDSMSSQLSAFTSFNKQCINDVSEKIAADKVEILDCFNAMNDTSEKMEAHINILEKSNKGLTKNINDTLYSDKLTSKVDKIKTNQSDIQYNVDHLNKT
eukprot:11949381-Ditylum_brightwellii.AAC.1